MSVDAGRFIRRYELSFAVSLPRGSHDTATQQRYAAAQGILFALLRHQDAQRAGALHDANQRKALAVSPLQLKPFPGGLARASLSLSVWQSEVTEIVDDALHSTSDLELQIAGLPAILISWTLADARAPAELLAERAPTTVSVRFDSPTFFSFGRHPSGTPRLQIVPDPGLVVASWLRAWKLTGDNALSWLPTAPEALEQLVALTAIDQLRTVEVIERGIRLTGCVGACSYRWEGEEERGRTALATLARFAGICGTGAKTGRGFGQTAFVSETWPTERRPK